MKASVNFKSYLSLCIIISSLLLLSCASNIRSVINIKRGSQITGSEFYKRVASANWRERDSLALHELLKGNLPTFIKKFVRIHTSINNSNGKTISAYYYVMPDYLSIGDGNDFARIPLTPMAAQKVADSFHCFLPTPKMVDDIYKQSSVKLEPVPIGTFRDSSPTMFQHHNIIEDQRKGRKGLIAGIKKDVILTDKLAIDKRPNRVAIYGWHKLDGQPIQPIYTGHINWYVDYSHGIRLVYRTIWVERRPMDYIAVMKDKFLRKLLCNEENCNVFSY